MRKNCARAGVIAVFAIPARFHWVKSTSIEATPTDTTPGVVSNWNTRNALRAKTR
jgi:hypothetical protein